jgi:hypothetical protein
MPIGAIDYFYWQTGVRPPTIDNGPPSISDREGRFPPDWALEGENHP